ncbi:MAG TPA: allantoinase AllB, partial [Pirellulales bacterium]|nr:allantoinase AllB [Pirellulales bacterium]
MPHDLIIRNAMVVRSRGVVRAELAIDDGRIEEIAPEIADSAREQVDAQGLHMFPGVLDAHVHFNDPGRTDWEGAATGSAAFAVGGGTCYFDMPLNASPPTLDRASFELKRAALERSSLVDFALWGGLVPGNVDRLDELADCGVIGFKAFMCSSGIDDFTAADDYTLLQGMRIAAARKLPVAVHAENHAICAGLAQAAIQAGRHGVRDYLHSRPILAEVEAISRATNLAAEAGCSLHIVHVSSGSGVAVVAEARSRGIDVTCETCPHYLLLTDEDVERLGAVAKCSPPIRTSADREALWEGLERGDVAFVASDHSPSPESMKRSSNFFDIWGGIAGCQTTLGLLLHEGYERRSFALNEVAAILATAPADRFNVTRKGRIEVGVDADLVLVDLRKSAVLEREDLRYRHRVSPYLGRTL